MPNDGDPDDDCDTRSSVTLTSKPPALAKIKRDVLAATRAIPPGFVTSYDAIGALLDVMPRQVAYILMSLVDEEHNTVPWHRVVKIDGSLSKTKPHLFAEQRTRLAQEGTTCDEAGEIPDFLERLTTVIVLTHRRHETTGDRQSDP